MKTLLAIIIASALVFCSGVVAKAGVQQWVAVNLAPVALALHR